MVSLSRSVLSGTPRASAVVLSRCSRACRNAVAVLKVLAIRALAGKVYRRSEPFTCRVALESAQEFCFSYQAVVQGLRDDSIQLLA